MVDDVVCIELLITGPLLAIWSRQNVPMDMGHRIVEIKGLVLIAGDKINHQLVHEIRHVLLVLECDLLAV